MRVLVTGANRGIGLELCRQLRARGAEVVGVCRGVSAELDALGVEVVAGVDVRDGAAPAAIANAVGDAKLDVLIHNAGVLVSDDLASVKADDVRLQLEVNAVAPLVITQALLPSLRQGSKVAIVTSLMGSMSDNGSGGYYGYRMSKAAVNAAGVSLARDLKGRGVAVVLLHPGFVRTGMTGQRGNVDPNVSARGLLDRIDELTLERSGRFFHADGRALAW